MDDYNGSVMIALLPTETDWCHIEFPHMTLVYVGKQKDLKPTTFNELAKDAASIAMLSGPIYLRVTGIDVFGRDEERVKVFRLMPSSELMAMRRTVESWNGSEYPFNPHVTIGPERTVVEYTPRVIVFNRIAVGWGKDVLTLWLKKATD